jgi:sialidase-1
LDILDMTSPMNYHGLLVFFLIILFNPGTTDAWPHDRQLDSPIPVPVFVAGTEGYACYRIPAIVRLGNGDLLAFAEGRKDGCSDTGDIDLLMKRSSDGGQSWSGLKVIWDDGKNTCGNPAPVVDAATGDIALLTTWNLGSDREPQIIDQQSTDTRRVFLLRSTDQGHSWTRPKEITRKVKKRHWTWYATGPGSGIQLKQGPHTGRMVVGCDHIEAGTKKYYSHSIYSDNGGRNWKLGGSSPQDQVNECEAAELPGGRLIMNMRNYDRHQKTRQIMYSNNGGLTWTDQQHHPDLIEPICQASLLSHGNLLLFSNPASRDKRERITLKLSHDLGTTWTEVRVLHQGPAAYSDLVGMSGEEIGCLYEAGQQTPYEHIVFQTVRLF